MRFLENKIFKEDFNLAGFLYTNKHKLSQEEQLS